MHCVLTVQKYESGSKKAMNSRSSSISLPAPRLQHRPSVTSRLSFAISNAEHGEATTAPTNVEHQIDEEIEKIKRYEVCAHDLDASNIQFKNANKLVGFHDDRYFLDPP